MKIKIGPYTHFWSTIRFEQWWMERRTGKYYFSLKDSDYTKLDLFVEKLCDGWQWVLNMTINQYTTRKKRKVKIQLDKYDTWSMDHTLALIVVPMLKQLKATKHGSPVVDDEDVPEELKSTSATPLTQEEKYRGETDEFFFDRWDWVIDEMIYAFEQLSSDDWPDYSDECKEKHARVQNGLNLFAKYYMALWD